MRDVLVVSFKNLELIMDYNIKEFAVKDLVSLIDNNRINLNPPYQRNFIWKPEDQMSLIDSVIAGYPLPSFFVYEKKDGLFELIDGQQRTKTIYKFVKGQLKSSKASGSKFFSDLKQDDILNYKLPFIIIKNINNESVLNNFYVLINKKGIHLNTAEIFKSEYSDKLFMQLANEVLTYQNLINLNLFTDAAINRMNDRSFIEELLVYLKIGIKDKKRPVEAIYNEDIDSDEYAVLQNLFHEIIDIINEFNQIKPIANTRYKQKNDFYTLFNFIHLNKTLPKNILKYQYQILLLIDGIDKEGKQFIRPSNESCKSFKEYANNCVTQTNSKNAREKRLDFFNDILKNTNIETNEQLKDVLNYFDQEFEGHEITIKSIGDFQLIDLDLLNSIP